MKVHSWVKGLFVIVAIIVIAILVDEVFEVPKHIVMVGLLALVYLKHEMMLEKLSADLSMVESFLEERYPDNFGGDDTFRRTF